MIAGFYHIATMGNWKEVVAEQVERITTSGLLAITDKIFVTVLGDEEVILPEKFQIVHRGKLEEYEFPTLKFMKAFCEKNQCRVFYLHTKGVSHPSENQTLWRKYMEYFNIDMHDKCVSLLDEFDVVGTEYVAPFGIWHYSGNFWWARSDYIRLLAIDDSRRNAAEEWICTGNPRVYNFFNSYRDLYLKPIYFDEYSYKNDMLQKIKDAGSDCIKVFYGSYDGGMYIQQVPEDLAAFIDVLSLKTITHSLEIGIASGGTTRFIRDHVPMETTTIIDDGTHLRHILWNRHKSGIKNLTEFIGDSHSQECRGFLQKLNRKFDYVLIDADHSYDGVKRDWEMVQPYLSKGAMIAFHDINFIPDVIRFWNEMKFNVVLETKYKLGIGVICS